MWIACKRFRKHLLEFLESIGIRNDRLLSTLHRHNDKKDVYRRRAHFFIIVRTKIYIMCVFNSLKYSFRTVISVAQRQLFVNVIGLQGNDERTVSKRLIFWWFACKDDWSFESFFFLCLFLGAVVEERWKCSSPLLKGTSHMRHIDVTLNDPQHFYSIRCREIYCTHSFNPLRSYVEYDTTIHFLHTSCMSQQCTCLNVLAIDCGP